MIKYEISYSVRKKITEDQLKKIKLTIKCADEILSLKAQDSYFDLYIVGDKKIRTLNRLYRNKDAITDVISLAYNHAFEIINSEFNHLGEVYLDLMQAQRQAKKYGHSLDREVCFLILHGLLHLIGYDHIEKNDEKVMFSLQDQILDKANIKR